LGGFVNFVLEKIQAPSSRTRYVDGAVRLLLRFVKVKYRIRAGYREPVGNERPVVSVSQWPVDKTKLVRGQPL